MLGEQAELVVVPVVVLVSSSQATPSWRPSCRRRTRTRRRTRPSCRRRTRPSCRTRTRTRPSRRTRPRPRTLLCGCSRLLRELINSLYLLRDSRACLELDQAILQSVSQCDGVVLCETKIKSDLRPHRNNPPFENPDHSPVAFLHTVSIAMTYLRQTATYLAASPLRLHSDAEKVDELFHFRFQTNYLVLFTIRNTRGVPFK